MKTPAVVVRAEQDQEDAARTLREAQLIAAPVVDAAHHLLGVLTVDDAMRILAEVDEEDAALRSGSQALRRSYLVTSILELVRSRIGWLLILIVAATLTVNVLDFFEDTLAQVVKLALFVPLLIGTGGNAGSQSATTVVQAMAVGDVRTKDLPRVVGREVAAGSLLGLTLAGVGVLPAAWFAGWSIAGVVCLSLVTICILATAVGSLIPILARRVGVDPAVVSAPLISTVVDATGLVVYFLTAQLVLGIGGGRAPRARRHRSSGPMAPSSGNRISTFGHHAPQDIPTSAAGHGVRELARVVGGAAPSATNAISTATVLAATRGRARQQLSTSSAPRSTAPSPVSMSRWMCCSTVGLPRAPTMRSVPSMLSTSGSNSRSVDHASLDVAALVIGVFSSACVGAAPLLGLTCGPRACSGCCAAGPRASLATCSVSARPQPSPWVWS